MPLAYDAWLEEVRAALDPFWWREQNRELRQECRKTPGCWLPQNHQGECQPVA